MNFEIKKDNFNELDSLYIGLVKSESKINNKEISIDLNEIKKLIHNKEKILYTASINDKNIGYILGLKIENKAFLYHLYVDEEYRNNKIGKILLNKFIEQCENEKIDEINLSVYHNNYKAREFYIKNGFSQNKEWYDKEKLKVINCTKELKMEKGL